ncbi:uncharacterized protein B0H18DRAFT_1042173 [Fomitopsis serialis]|uniref:uncharacterized protein n=1 Tax=Fomitopsis serialis TaxID=139415 RepID=UPI002008B59E|nr:uncharacterized protein B0H18DRAFT_1042173 [Neoantrodia serialis]KAH9915213.1 hypothetical protein B0H18DRAFT_1042173 [Neoantrodia serialis]
MSIDHRSHLRTLPIFLVSQSGHACLIVLSPRWPGRLGGTIALCILIQVASASAYRDTSEDARRLAYYSLGHYVMCQAFSVFLFNWLTDPIHDFRHEHDHTPPAELPFLRRVTHIPPRPTEPRWRCLRQTLLSAFRCFLFIDLAQVYQRSNPLFSRQDMDLRSQGLFMLPLNIVARFGSVVAMIAMEYSLLAATCVALGVSSPRHWPDIYGKWSDSYTVRSIHLQLTAGIGKACCRALGLQPGTWVSSYTQLYVGFAVSGFLHCGGDLMVDPSLFGASFPFYISQAVAITFEDAVIGIVRRTGVKFPQPLARVVGYAWAILWLCISAPWHINWTLKAGVVDTVRVPVSLIDLIAPNLGAFATSFTPSIAMSFRSED